MNSEEIAAAMMILQKLFVTLEEFAGFLYIKAVWGIEEKWGYDLETVLNSTFCYKLHSMNSDFEPPAFSMTLFRVQRYNKKMKGQRKFLLLLSLDGNL